MKPGEDIIEDLQTIITRWKNFNDWGYFIHLGIYMLSPTGDLMCSNPMAHNLHNKSTSIFTESALEANSVTYPQCPSVVFAIAEYQIPKGLLVEECFANKSCFLSFVDRGWGD